MARKTNISKNLVPTGMSPAESTRHEERERKYRVEESMRTLTRAEEIRKDKGLMREVKAEAKRMHNSIVGRPARGK